MPTPKEPDKTDGAQSGIHPLNPSIVRGPSGILSEFELVVVDWEVPTERRLITDDMVGIMDASSPVARVDLATKRKQERKHRETILLWRDFDYVIQDWEWWRKQSPEESRRSAYERWQFVQGIADALNENAWPLLTVLEKQPDGSAKIITSHRRRDSFWLRINSENWTHRGRKE